jgi:hypothetical protein
MAVYNTMEEGVADTYRLMQRNQAKNGKTLAGALHGWAENSYVDSLAKELGISPNDPFDVNTADPQMIQRLMQKQFGHEGRKGSHTASADQIMGGIVMARNPKTAENTGSDEQIVKAGAAAGMSKEEIAHHIQEIHPEKGTGECVDLVQKFHPDVGNVHGWRRGEPGSKMPSGSGLAIFSDKRGNPTEKYDGGGSGTRRRDTPGHIETSHGVIRGPDLPGGGFEIANQWVGQPWKWENATPGNPDRRLNSDLYYGIKDAEGHQRGVPQLPGQTATEKRIERDNAQPSHPPISPYAPTKLDNVDDSSTISEPTTTLSKQVAATSMKEEVQKRASAAVSPPAHHVVNSHQGSADQGESKHGKNAKGRVGRISPPNDRLVQLFTNPIGGVGSHR